MYIAIFYLCFGIPQLIEKFPRSYFRCEIINDDEILERFVECVKCDDCKKYPFSHLSNECHSSRKKVFIYFFDEISYLISTHSLIVIVTVISIDVYKKKHRREAQGQKDNRFF